MKKLLNIGTIGVLALLILFTAAYSQKEKELFSVKKPQGEVTANSDQYVIGPEDVLLIHVWKENDLSRTVPVRADGKISIPLINEVQAAGLSPLQLRDTITQRLKEYIDDPIVTVIVTEANSYKVYVAGQVKAPGTFKIRSETTILQIISMAGGLTDWANPKKIMIVRKEAGKEKRIIVNYKKILSDDNPSLNIVLRPGDTIVVP
jgi:polysaccharide export outer membrane protein